MSHSTPTNLNDTNTLDDTPRIYVACLAAYNNGKLHGAWIDASQEPEAILEAVQTMLKASPERGAKEWSIHDYEGFHSIKLSEWEGFAEVHAYATFIEEHGRLGAEVHNYYGDLKEAQAALNDRYPGCYPSIADFAQELTEATTTIPQNLAYYIDYERMARDMEMSGDILTVETDDGMVHMFWNH